MVSLLVINIELLIHFDIRRSVFDIPDILYLRHTLMLKKSIDMKALSFSKIR